MKIFLWWVQVMISVSLTVVTLAPIANAAITGSPAFAGLSWYWLAVLGVCGMAIAYSSIILRLYMCVSRLTSEDAVVRRAKEALESERLKLELKRLEQEDLGREGLGESQI